MSRRVRHRKNPFFASSLEVLRERVLAALAQQESSEVTGDKARLRLGPAAERPERPIKELPLQVLAGSVRPAIEDELDLTQTQRPLRGYTKAQSLGALGGRLKFGTDLTEAAREGRLDPLVGPGPDGNRLSVHGMEETKLWQH